MSKLPHTEGPWRWEISMESKRLHLVGGRPQYDLTIMDFDRWGMGGAVATLRDTAHDGMNIMHRLCDRPDWIAPVPGREHHRGWLQMVTHPDMRLIEAAPLLQSALVMVISTCLDARSHEALMSNPTHPARVALRASGYSES